MLESILNNMIVEARVDKDEVGSATMYNTQAVTELESGNTNNVDKNGNDSADLQVE